MESRRISRMSFAVVTARGLRFAVLPLVAILPSTATAQNAAPQAVEGANSKPAESDDRKICRSEGKSGTHLVKKRCMLKSQWAELDRKAYFSNEERRFQQNASPVAAAAPF